MDVQMIIDLLILAWLTWLLISLRKSRKIQEELIDVAIKRIESNEKHMRAMEDFKKFFDVEDY